MMQRIEIGVVVGKRSIVLASNGSATTTSFASMSAVSNSGAEVSWQTPYAVLRGC